MPKEILIYGNIHSAACVDMISAMNEVEPDAEMLLRVNTDGGQPQDGFGLAAKFAEFAGKKSIQVDGRAYSTGLFLLCYSENVQAVEPAQFMVHRAGYSEWFEGSEFFTEALKANLVSINKSLEKAFRNKIDVAKFEELKGVKIKDLFDIEKPRTDVFFTAPEAKKIGLINKVVKITPATQKKVNAQMEQIAAKYDGGEIYKNIVDPVSAESNNDEKTNSQIKIKTMTKKELLAAHPEICAELIADGVAKEKERVGAWMVNAEIDLNAVKAGIDSGKDFGQKDMAEFGQKQIALNAQKGLENDSTDDVDTDPKNQPTEDPSAEKSAAEKLEASIDAHLEIENK